MLQIDGKRRGGLEHGQLKWANPGHHPTGGPITETNPSSSSSWFQTDHQKHRTNTQTSSSNCLFAKYNVLLSRVLWTEHMNAGNWGLLLVPCTYRDTALSQKIYFQCRAILITYSKIWMAMKFGHNCKCFGVLVFQFGYREMASSIVMWNLHRNMSRVFYRFKKNLLWTFPDIRCIYLLNKCRAPIFLAFFPPSLVSLRVFLSFLS